MAAPLNRAWYDTLVDDDGSGNVGTVWNKAAVDALLDSVDASLTGIVDKTGTPPGSAVAVFTDADSLTGTANVAADIANGGLILDSPVYAYVTLTDRSQPANGRIFRIAVSGGTLSLVSMDDANGTIAVIEMSRSGRLRLSNGQIGFPAVQIPSADPNTLDDYREGTWAPTFVSTGGQSGQAYAVQEGSFTKIGSRVFISGRIAMSALGTFGAGSLAVSLPFAASNRYNPGGVSILTGGGFALAFSSMTAFVGQASAYMYLTYVPAGGGTFQAMSPTALTAGSDLWFAGSYVAAN